MTTTEHLNLHTWELSDAVSLAEINENFTRIDANAKQADEKQTAQTDALALLAFRTARNALRTYSKDPSASETCGIGLYQFANGASEIEDSEHIVFENGYPAVAYPAQPSLTLTPAVTYLKSGDVVELGTITATGFGTIESITSVLSSGSDHCAVSYSLWEGNTRLSSAAVLDVDDGGGTAALETPIKLWPNRTLTVKAYGKNDALASAQMDIVGDLTLTVRAEAYESGWLTTKPFTAQLGSKLLVWVWWKHSSPQVSIKLGDEEIPLAPVNTGVLPALNGEDAVCSFYCAENICAPAAQVRFTLDTASRILEAMAIQI